MTESNRYEDLRDSVEGEIGVSWRDADRHHESLTATYRDLKADDTLSEHGRFEKAQRLYETYAPKIERGRARARQLAREEAGKAQRSSVPMPEGQTLGSTKIPDSTALVAIQNETQMLLSRIETLRARMPQGLNIGEGAGDALRHGYAEGLETGGVEGRTKCRAVLAAAKVLGVEADSIVDAHRTEEHRAQLDRARRLTQVASTIGGKAPEPPFSAQERRGGDFHSGDAKFLFQPKRHTRQPTNPRKQNPWAR